MNGAYKELKLLASEQKAAIERLRAAHSVAEVNLNIAKANLHGERLIIERLRAALKAISRRSAPSTRTWGKMLADMGWVNDEARRALEPKP